MNCIFQLILASKSPRRSQMLKEAGYEFSVVSPDTLEVLKKDLNLDEQIVEIAKEKAHHVLRSTPPLALSADTRSADTRFSDTKFSDTKPFIILSADTVVVIDGKVLGKPQNVDEAKYFLNLLSGQKHQVKTAIYIIENKTGHSFSHIETTEVSFHKLSAEDINEYIDSGEPFDKAGAYGIQGGAQKFVQHIQGSYNNIVGFPLEAFERLCQVNHLWISKCKVVAVSKWQTTQKIRTLYSEGFKDFAENYVQEWIPKKEELKDLSIVWHFIGRLQRNKLKFIVGQCDWIHSLDSVMVAAEIDKITEIIESEIHRQKNFRRPKILIQVNLSDEPSKGGFFESELRIVIPELMKFEHLDIRGFMTMPPLQNEPNENRNYFRKLNQICWEWTQSYPQLRELSMGTSSDYEVAKEEGATFVRLGTILFGEREKK